ncbi:MAG: peptidylprolyl isomerase [Burkholderiaceae bacterium]|nr:MAG: peptidylprolyl isomerase [Burkholderiaceae bacterium]
MFEYIRTHQKLMMVLLLVLIVPPFALFGIQGYSHFGSSADVLAKVEGQKITQQLFDQQFHARLEGLRQGRADFDVSRYTTPAARQQFLDSLIYRALMDRHLSKSYLMASDAWLQNQIASKPDFQTDGHFDAEKYKFFLASQGMSSAAYEADLRYRQTLTSYTNLILKTGSLPTTVAQRLAMLKLQERQVEALWLSPSAFTDQVKLEDAAVQKYYDDNPQKFTTPARADIEYVVLDQAAVAAQIPLKEEEIAAFYNQNQSKFGPPEERRASHILITIPAAATPEDKAKARAKAESVLAKVKAAPKDFANLAKQYSEDIGSGAAGGDVGFFSRDMMAKPFEDAAFSMKEGEIKGLVESQFGFHIIKLTAIKAPQIKPLSEVRAQIETELRKGEVTRRYLEAAETFKNMVYEQADSLQPVATRFGLKIQSQSGVGPESVSEHLNEKLLKALFTEDVLKQHHNTEAIELGNSALIAARVVNYTPSSKRSLENAQNEIRATLTLIEAQKLAVKAGEEKLAALRKGDAKEQTSATGFGDKVWVSRPQPKDVDERAMREIFKADTRQLPAFVGVDLGSRGYAIYRIGAVGTTQLPEDKKAILEESIQGVGMALGGAQQTAAYEVLKARSNVQLLHPAAVATE